MTPLTFGHSRRRFGQITAFEAFIANEVVAEVTRKKRPLSYCSACCKTRGGGRSEAGQRLDNNPYGCLSCPSNLQK